MEFRLNQTNDFKNEVPQRIIIREDTAESIKSFGSFKNEFHSSDADNLRASSSAIKALISSSISPS